MPEPRNLIEAVAGDLRFALTRSGCMRPAMRRSGWRRVEWSVLMLPLGGGFRVRLRGQAPLRLPAGDVGIVPAETEHGYEVDDPDAIRVRWVHVRYTVLGQWDLLPWLRLPPVVRDEALAEAVTRLQESATAPRSLRRVADIQAAGFALLAALLRLPHAEIGEVAALAAVQALLPAARFVREHLAEPIGVADLARALGRSPATVHRLFNEAAGMPPMRYVQEQRLSLARRRLEAGDEPIQQVAQACGFADPYHFSRAFRRRFGRAPSEHRRATRLAGL